MDFETLLAEGKRLSRPSVWLVKDDTQGNLTGYWGGKGIVLAPEGLYEHWLSIDCRFLPENLSRPGCMSLYQGYEMDEELYSELGGQIDDYSEFDLGYPAIVYDESTVFKLPKAAETPLYSKPMPCFPILDVLYRFGSPEIKAWMIENKWNAEYGDSNFQERELSESYRSYWQTKSPVFRKDLYAMLGGWSIPWPEGDWDDLINEKLLIQTFERAEPWMEVWEIEQQLKVIERIT